MFAILKLLAIVCALGLGYVALYRWLLHSPWFRNSVDSLRDDDLPTVAADLSAARWRARERSAAEQSILQQTRRTLQEIKRNIGR